MDCNQIIQSFQAKMRVHGITPPNQLITDGQLHRFHISGDKRGSKNGWYTLYCDNIPYGAFGNWKDGISIKWSLKKHDQMSSIEHRELQRQIAEIKLHREIERKRIQGEAAKLAECTYNSSFPANPSHPYLVRKRIRSFCARRRGNSLLLPIMDFSGKLWSLQYIAPHGGKWFLPNGAIAGHFIPIQHQPTLDRKILICEGFATGATLAESFPDDCVIAACDAGNLKPVAIDIRRNLTKAKIVICADDDRLTTGNPGLTKGSEAAIYSEALLVKPDWPEGSPSNLTDFNDLACWQIGMMVQHD